MRAEAVSYDDWSMGNPPAVDNDKWHVQFSSDEVKVVSLEQLDDLFRLSIVDSETQVWQTGMTEWQPLRVIAGLDEQPAPQAKRAPPKPPMRAASPSVRPAPPPARPESPSVRPAMPAPRSAPPPAARPAYVAPASFYSEPIVATPASYRAPTAYAEPIAFAATMPAANSVRPLVVSQPPPMVQRGGGGFGRFLVGLALLAGVGVTAYRNDFLREGAHAAHQDALYARLETALGGPAFGTVRALEQSAAAQAAVDVSSSNEAALRVALPAVTPAAPSTPAASAGDSPAQTAATGAPPVVSLESLGREKKGQAAAAAAQAAVAPAPARAAISFAQPKPAASPVAAKPAVRASAAPKAAVEKPAPVSHKPASEMSDRELLNAAIGQSVMMQNSSGKSKSKAKAKANEYDPLNPSL
ncbi:MAG TPA: DUF4339 domain-containing protein [Polyangiaceae bacterium]